MPIHRLLENQGFGPEEIEVIVGAFHDALLQLGLRARSSPAVVEIVASRVFMYAQQGERDRTKLRDLALNSFRN